MDTASSLPTFSTPAHTSDRACTTGERVEEERSVCRSTSGVALTGELVPPPPPDEDVDDDAIRMMSPLAMGSRRAEAAARAELHVAMAALVALT